MPIFNTLQAIELGICARLSSVLIRFLFMEA